MSWDDLLVPGTLFDGYERDGFFDEVFADDGSVRPHFAALVKRIGELTPDELSRRERLLDEAFRSQGITFTVYGAEEGIERTFPLDLLPARHPGQRVGRHRARAHPAGHRPEPVPRRPVRRRGRRAGGRHRAPLGGHQLRGLRPPGPRGARPAGRSVCRGRHRPRARWRRRMAGAGGQPPQPERHQLRAREPGGHDARAAGGIRRQPRPAGRRLRAAPARRPAPPRPTGRWGRPDRGRAHAWGPQQRLLRARLPGPADGGRAGRGPRPRRRRARRVDAHDPRPAARST